MSFEIWISCFQNEQNSILPVEELRRRFAPHLGEERDGTWPLVFDEGPCGAEVYVEPNDPTGFSVGRPPDFPAFWKIIAGILRDFPCVLYWPGGGAVMGSLDLLEHLPRDFVEIVGVPWVSTDPAKIEQMVWQNS